MLSEAPTAAVSQASGNTGPYDFTSMNDQCLGQRLAQRLERQQRNSSYLGEGLAQGKDLALQDAAWVQAGEGGQVLGSHHGMPPALLHQHALQLRARPRLLLRKAARHLRLGSPPVRLNDPSKATQTLYASAGQDLFRICLLNAAHASFHHESLRSRRSREQGHSLVNKDKKCFRMICIMTCSPGWCAESGA